MLFTYIINNMFYINFVCLQVCVIECYNIIPDKFTLSNQKNYLNIVYFPILFFIKKITLN